jgi:DNA-binding MarR family transcriptional regulator
MASSTHIEESGRRVATDLRRCISRMGRLLAAGVPRGTLSQAKLSALVSLTRDGSANATELSQRMTIRPQSLTRILADLEAQELLTRTRASEDGREHLLAITGKGLELVRQEGLRRDRLMLDAMRRSLNSTEIEVLTIAAKILEKMANEWRAD